MQQLFDSNAFKDSYTYKGSDLGATYTKECTKLRVWAPTADSVCVNLYEQGSGDNFIESLEMKQDVAGTWIITLDGDRDGLYYTYLVEVNGMKQEAVDLYAKAVGVNGKRAMILDLNRTNPERFLEDKRPHKEKNTDMIIYELHVRDLSSEEESGIKNVGKFLGVVEEGTKNKEGLTTGLDHIKELGVTHIHFLPIFDYETIDESKLDEPQFNWGYDPENYNVPEGSYSTNPFDGAVRIKELKQMIQKLHDNGIGIIMDVVYNHTSKSFDSNFHKIVPEYYHRFNGTEFSNASGCGNETASERAMVRKYFVESLTYWAKEYHIDGFRFDLMGIHDIETMNEIRHALDEVDPSIFIYGEGWTCNPSVLKEEQRALKVNTPKLDRIASFSDDLRDAIKGSVFEFDETGFVSGTKDLEESIKFGVVGATNHPQIDYSNINYSEQPWAKEPDYSINYVSAHDNLTLWDKIAVSHPKDSYEERVRINKLAAAIVFTAQGVPFFQAGEEMLRTKPADEKGKFVEDSYKSPDSVNSIKWSQKSKTLDVFEYYKGLIALRKAEPGFRMDQTTEVAKKLRFMDTNQNNVVAYTIEEEANTLVVIYNGNKKDVSVTIKEGSYDVLVNENKAGVESLATVTGSTVTVPHCSCLVLKTTN